MKLVTFDKNGQGTLGAILPEGILDLPAAGERLSKPVPASMQALIDSGPCSWDVARELIATSPEECILPHATLLPPLPRPVRVRDCCLFLEHLEASFKTAGFPFSEEFRKQIIYYNADNIHIYGHDQDVPWPANSVTRDYELEWACVVGRPGTDIPQAEARDYIFGYTIFNDWSARDLQIPFMTCQLGPGGGKDFANSFGPCIVTTDEVPNPYALGMQARINGETWSNGSTSSMHHTFEDALVQLSKGRPMVPGEILGSGTVLNGCGLEIGRELELGDVVELEVEGVGILRNRLVAG
ncbi:MAG: fumarylacetoacetate hydrolase family protein [Hyphomonas sp.]|nr:fumarylacetoacetate hydrolase family protein [Hyphomonas sp.]